MHSKGQGTIEYLVILAVIVVVSLIVVSLMINSTAPAQGISGTTSTIATASTLLSVTESIVSEDGNYFLKIKNNTGENITITKIEIGDIIDATPNKPIPMNVEEAFILATDSLCSQGQLLAEEVTITYTNQYDLVKKQTFPVPINFECEEFTATVSYTDKDGVTHNEGGGTSGGPTQTCGNNTIEGTEICDGTELGLTTTCQDYDIIYDGGTLYCNNTCDDYNVELCTLAPQTKYTYFSGNDFSYGTFENTKLGSVLADGNAGQITNGLVGLWHLDDSENDSSASGFDGIWNGSEEYTPGLFNTNGGTFDGSTDYIQIDDVTNYYPMTISLWFKSNDIITMGLVGNYQGASYNGWHIYQHTTLGYGLYYYTTGSSTTNRTGTPLAGEVEVGKWKHLVATVDSSGAKIYINGVLDEQGVWTGTPGIPSTTNKMRIGAYGGTMLTNKFNGDIDEVAIWNRSLSEPEVRQIYGAYMDANYYSEVIDTGDTGNPTEYNSIKFNTEEVSYGSEINPTTEKSLADGLVGLWHLNESSGATTFADSSGNGNNGTCSNCPSQATGLWETNAFDFSGTSEEIILGTNPNILPTNAISYSVWVKPDNISTNKGIMVSDTDYDGGFNLFIITTGGGTYRVYSNIGGLKIVAGNKAQIGNWTHLVATFNGSEIRLYENGLLTGSISASGSITGSTELRLSGDTTGAVSNFDGMIEEPSVWNRALSASEVKELFNKGASRLGMSYRSCTNDDCSDKGNNWDGTSYDANTLINLSSLGANRYFQFKANFKIIEVGETPTISEPDSIPGLALWLKADAITGVSDGQKISTWNDSSGNNRNFSQGTSSRQPTYETNELNGLPVIRFIGSSIQTMTNSTNFSAPVTVIYMVRQTGGYNNRMLSGLSNNWLLGYWSSAKNKAYFVGWVTSSTAGSPATDTSWHTYSAVIPGSSASSAYGDGALLASNSGGVSGPNGLSLSGHQASSEFSNGEIAEVIVYNSALNTTNRETVEAYLAEKYGFSPAQEPQIFPQATPKLADVNIVYTN